jgi:cytochrome P450
MSEEIWGDPQEFRPERFLDENMKIINEDKLFVFGGGKSFAIIDLRKKL